MNNYRDMTSKTTFQNFHVKFLNSDFSVDNALNVTKLLLYVLCSLFEGRVSQNLDLGPGCFLMLCRNFLKKNLSLFFTFYLIKIKQGPKFKT